jgi:hypothetical protein
MQNMDMTSALFFRAFLALIGLVIFLLSTTLTITADRTERKLILHYRSLLKENTREILFSQIESIELEMNRHRSHSRRSSGPTYRIVVVLKDGTVVPFHQYFSSGSGDKTHKVKQLREYIGVGGSEMGMGLMGTLRELSKAAQVELEAKQEALTGENDDIHQTNGVSWQIQTVAFGGSPVTRWFSAGRKTSMGFVYITQLAEGQKNSVGGGLLAGLGSMLYKQSMAIYGFGPAEAPGADQASTFDPQNSLLSSFSVFTNAPAMVQEILTPRCAAAFSDWARRYPLKTIQAGSALFQQLVVLFSPQGIYIASLGTLAPEAVEEMTRLGVELVKS